MPRLADKFAFFVELALQQEENKYSDEQLAELMKEHFPNFAGPHMIAAYRRDYNRQLRPAFAKPETPLAKYIDGQAVPEGKRSLPKVKEAPEAEAEAEGDETFAKDVAASAARAAKAKAAKAPKTTEKVAAKPAPALKVVKKKYVRVPLGHQTAAVARFSGEDRAALFLDMRLGKSFTTILWAQKRGYKRILLVAPATPLIDWVTELETEGNRVRMVSGSPAKRAALLAEEGEGWWLITYGSLVRTPEVLQEWDLIILDESTVIKNPKAGVTKFCFKYLHECAGARAILSGLPSPQDDMELWTQMAWVSPDKRWLGFSNYWHWREAFCKQIGFSWELRMTHRPIVRKALHADAFVMSRKDAGLPNIKQYRRVSQPLDPDAEAAMLRLIADWEIDGIEVKYAPQIAGISHRLAGGFSPGRVYPCWKYGEVRRLVEKEFPGEPVVVWFAYNPEIHRMKSWLESKGHACSVLVGTMSRAERKRQIDLFRSGATKVLLGQPACAKFGLDLSVADVEVYFSCPYSYEGRRQSEERIIHPTKKRDTLVLDLVSSGSADEAVQETLRDRKSSATYFLSRFTKLFKLKLPTGAASTRAWEEPA